ncbi:MAG: UvrD-helicase domain-containing protein, partial [Burkholderiaceae bacterium]|nr:UvrD-helicase domain-containing protein [Burkholderiaceae bacterium]
MNAPLQHPVAPQPLHALSFPLWGGRLIEASAGTGKTWTIAALYLRLVLGHGADGERFARPLAPADILVMTFTRAATRELSDRIRARLLEAARCFRGEDEAGDAFLSDLLAAYPKGPARQQAALRLAMAADAMDDASVFTIDAWCQRMLREHAFDSGNLFDEELEPDEEALRTEAAQDYWRTACYPLDAEALEGALSAWKDVEVLAKDAGSLIALGVEDAWVSTENLATVMAQCQQVRQAAVDALRTQWVDKVKVMRDYVASQMPAKNKGWNGRRFSDKTINGWLDTLQAWAQGSIADEVPPLTDTAWTRLTPNGLAEARQDGESLPADLPSVFADFAQLGPALEALPRTATAARQHAAAWIAQRMQTLKRQAGRFGFADMLQRLDQALHGPHAERLRERIRTQFPVALIDEFQDTSPLQYRLFQAIYPAQEAARDHALLLIGDPKQSIYGFRGADIHSYLQARRATEGRHYVLGTNHRSTEALVGVVNHCFAQAEQAERPQDLGGATGPAGAFLFRQGQDDPVPFVAVQARGRAESWVNAQGPLPALALVHDLEMLSQGRHQRRFAARCAAQIVAWLNDPTNGFAHPQTGFARLRPRDIAVLVRTGKEAASVRRALQQRGVASVFLSDKDSVFQSDEARDLVHWLRGVAQPQDARRVRTALAVATLGLPLAELARLASDDQAFDERADLLRELQAVWQRQGVLAMLRQTLHRLHLAARWLREDEGERRLTNLLHLAELLQAASGGLEGEEALVRWLQRQIDEAASAGGMPADAQILRLESDADLVKVVTMHQSKGLEYPVVCVPFGTSFRGTTKDAMQAVLLPGDEGQKQLAMAIDDTNKAVVEQERLREDLRLLYVALTRPRHGLWLGFAALKVGNAKDCQSHLSALGQLLGGGQAVAAEDWRPVLQALALQGGIDLQAG